jgi:hypothetical protein
MNQPMKLSGEPDWLAVVTSASRICIGVAAGCAAMSNPATRAASRHESAVPEALVYTLVVAADACRVLLLD